MHRRSSSRSTSSSRATESASTPDDFQLETASGAQGDVVGSQPYCERLTHDGKPVDWRDPSVVGDPDLRMLAYFRVPATARGKTLVVDYETKYSAPFEPR